MSPRSWILPVALVVMLLILGRDGSAPADPARRTVRVETGGCGLAADRRGAGVVVEDELVVTVAHLVAEAETVRVDGGVGAVEASVVAIDLKRDLALLRIEGLRFPALDISTAEVGDTGRIIGGVTAPSIVYTVDDRVALTIEEVLGTSRHRRLGYRLRANTGDGDSGAGAFDEAGRLVGIVFATDEGGSTWITAAWEVEDFLARHRDAIDPLICDRERSRLG